MALDSRDHALEHLPHLAGREVPQPLPGQLAILLAPGAVEDDQVQVRVQPHIGRCPLHYASDSLRACLGMRTAIAPSSIAPLQRLEIVAHHVV